MTLCQPEPPEPLSKMRWKGAQVAKSCVIPQMHNCLNYCGQYFVSLTPRVRDCKSTWCHYIMNCQSESGWWVVMPFWVQTGGLREEGNQTPLCQTGITVSKELRINKYIKLKPWLKLIFSVKWATHICTHTHYCKATLLSVPGSRGWIRICQRQHAMMSSFHVIPCKDSLQASWYSP